MLAKPIFDVVYTVALLCNALLYVPQIIRLYKDKHTDNISVVTFVGFNMIQLVAFLNGWNYNDMPFFIGKLVSFIASSVLLWMIVYYKVKNRSANDV